MSNECLIIDLSDSGLAQSWHDETSKTSFAMTIKVLSDLKSLKQELSNQNTSAIMVFVSDYSSTLQKTLRQIFSAGFTTPFVAIVCDSPSDKLLMTVYEYGIDEFLGLPYLKTKAVDQFKKWQALLENKEIPLTKIQKIHRTLALSKRPNYAKMCSALEADVDSSAEAAFVKGKTHEADNSYKQAIDSYKLAKETNGMFRPSIMRLGELLLLVGKSDEALNVFSELESTNPLHAERKGLIAMCYVAKGETEQAQKYLETGKKIDPEDLKIAEASAGWLLHHEKIDEALEMMSTLDEIGPFFAAKLNEIGIKLSQEGHGDQAIQLYEKAHSVIHDSLKYKISMNLALAYRRSKELKKAYSYAERCEAEFGESFDKLEKVKTALKREME